MSDKAAKVIADAVRDHLGFHDCPTDENDCCADIILAALKDAGIAVVELQSVDGLRFTHEDGTSYTPDELRHFAGEALAAAAARDE